MSLYDTVKGWANDAVDSAGRFSDAIGEWFSALPNSGSPVLTAMKMGNAAIDAGVKVGQGVPLAVAVSQSETAYAQGGTLGTELTAAGSAVLDTASGFVDSVKSTIADLTSGPPLWVKIIIAGAVVVGVVYVLEGAMSHATAAA